MRYTLWDSGCTHSINPYFELYTELKNLEKVNDIELNYIGGIINPKGICTAVLDLKYDTGKLNYLTFEKIYELSGAPNLLISPQKWTWGRGKDEVGREGTNLNVMGKRSILICNNRKSQRTIIHAHGCALPEISINQGQEGLTKFYSMIAEFF